MQDIRDASPPFNKATADVILRSSDRVDFRVGKFILAEASPVFEAMFRLPESARNGETEGDKRFAECRDNLPVVPMEEDSAILDKLLRLCYPIPSPVFSDPAELQPVLDAALRYGMDVVVETIKDQMRSLVNEAGMPLRIYAMSLKYNFEEEVRIAALSSLAQTIENVYAPELEKVTAGAYYRLFHYRQQCSEETTALLRGHDAFEWVSDQNLAFILNGSVHQNKSGKPCQWWWSYILELETIIAKRPSGKAFGSAEAEAVRDEALLEAFTCVKCKPLAAAQLREFTDVYTAAVDAAVAKVVLQIDPPVLTNMTETPGSLMTQTSDSFSATQEIRDASPPFNKATADVILRSLDRVDFRVRKFILSEASPVFAAKFGLLQPARKGETGNVTKYRDDLPILPVEEDSAILDKLLRFCYPISSPSLHNLAELRAVLDAALRYNMDDTAQVIRLQIQSRVDEAGMPLRIYAMSMQYNFEEEVRMAAFSSLAQPIRDVYAPELEEITAGAYYRLLNYRKQCSDEADGLLRGDGGGLKYGTDFYFEWLSSRDWIFFSDGAYRVSVLGSPQHDCSRNAWIYVGRNHTHVKPVTWWWKYITKLKTVTGERPCGKALVEAEALRDEALMEASTCRRCKTLAGAHLRDFITEYAAAVDTAVAKVVLQIKWSQSVTCPDNLVCQSYMPQVHD